MHNYARNILEHKYRVWLETHQDVFALFEQYALVMLHVSRRFGIGMICERVRWEVRTTWRNDDEGFKINNNWRAYIARDLIVKHPALEALLETRLVRGEETFDNNVVSAQEE